MGVRGQFVKTFAEATHAVPNGMHMGADYPFMICTAEVVGKLVRIKCGSHEETLKIRKEVGGREYCQLAQRSTYETLFNRPPKMYRFFPFKDQHTPEPPR